MVDFIFTVFFCLKEAWSKTTSLVVVRHPLARLASVYQEKFVKYADNKESKNQFEINQK